MNLKKRIIGFLLLAGIILISIPLFFGHSVSTTELKLSATIPKPPAKPQDLSIPIPSQPSENLNTTAPPTIFTESTPSKPIANTTIATPLPAAPLQDKTAPIAPKAPTPVSPIN